MTVNMTVNMKQGNFEIHEARNLQNFEFCEIDAYKMLKFAQICKNKCQQQKLFDGKNQ